MEIRRMWINQPSTAQPLHDHHRTNVLAVIEDINAKSVRVYFTSGDIISAQIPRLCLSHGWVSEKKVSS